MKKSKSNIYPRIERAEIDARRIARNRPERAKPPAPDDPHAVDCTHHDGFAWEIYKLRGMFAVHPQDKRMTAAERLTLRFIFWRMHKPRADRDGRP